MLSIRICLTLSLSFVPGTQDHVQVSYAKQKPQHKQFMYYNGF